MISNENTINNQRHIRFLIYKGKITGLELKGINELGFLETQDKLNFYSAELNGRHSFVYELPELQIIFL